MKNLEVRGKQFGVRFVERDNDGHICIQLLGEDDENWFEVGNRFSSYWLEDLIGVLQNAKVVLDMQAQKGRWGYDFKD